MLGFLNFMPGHYKRIHSGECVHCVGVMESIVSAKIHHFSYVLPSIRLEDKGTLLARPAAFYPVGLSDMVYLVPRQSLSAPY